MRKRKFLENHDIERSVSRESDSRPLKTGTCSDHARSSLAHSLPQPKPLQCRRTSPRNHYPRRLPNQEVVSSGHLPNHLPWALYVYCHLLNRPHCLKLYLASTY
jgi:hypothetical protein